MTPASFGSGVYRITNSAHSETFLATSTISQLLQVEPIIFATISLMKSPVEMENAVMDLIKRAATDYKTVYDEIVATMDPVGLEMVSNFNDLFNMLIDTVKKTHQPDWIHF